MIEKEAVKDMQINQMRFAGLASGLDTESIVKGLMDAERIPLTKLLQQKQTLEWKRDSYREVNTLVNNFNNLVFNGVFRQSTFSSKTVSTSNENAVSARAVGASSNVSAQIQVSQLATSEVWVSNERNEQEFASSAETLTFNVTKPGGESSEVIIQVDETDTLDDVIRKFNNSGLGVSMFEDTNGKLVMTMNETGAGASIQLADQATIDFMTGSDKLNFSVDGELLQSQISGQNSKFEINGYETERTSNVFTINGMEYTLKNTTTTPVSISTATDVDGIFDTVVKFVDEYNNLIDELNGKLTERIHRDYKPLTDEQREEMSEKQIEMWEEKAKSGLLRNDAAISGALNEMRMDMYKGVQLENGTTLFLSDFGISPIKDYMERGKLEIDVDKLREKISEDPNKLYELFNGSPGATDSDNEDSVGIAERLRTSMRKMTRSIEERAGNDLRTNQQFTLGRNIIDVDKQIERMQDRLQRIEDRYWRQFTAMEQAIQHANQQSMFLMEQFGG